MASEPKARASSSQHGEGKAPERLRRAERVLGDRTEELTLVLEEPYDPQNLSATFRTAEALGLQDVHVIRDEPWRVKRKVTQRADRWLTIHRWKRLEEALPALRREGFRILVAGLGEGARPLGEIRPAGRIALAFGNESRGASAALIRQADGEVWIPTLGFTGSLNLSVAVAIALSDLRRRQVEARGRAGDLPEERRALLREQWYRRLAGGHPFREKEYLDWIGRVEPVEGEGPPPDRRDGGRADGSPLLESTPPGASAPGRRRP